MAPNVQAPPPVEEKASQKFHHFDAPEAWARSPIMRVLSPSSTRTCLVCGSSTNISQILSSAISIDFSSPTNAMQKYTKGASDKCFSCTTILGLFRSISKEAKPAQLPDDRNSLQKAKDYENGICRIIIKDKLQPRLYQIFVGETTPSCPINVPRLPLLQGPSSSSATRFIKQQIKTCLRTHSICKNQALDFIPTRLLHVTREGDIHLRFQTDIPANTKYAALSHRWGRERIHPCSTTRDNIDSRKQNITWDELPQVFHEALAFTLRLGLSYIWIDSLCIVQGDELDWNRETSDIARIFNSALVTIATHCSQNPSETMFPPHSSLQDKIITLKQGSTKHELHARELTPSTAGILHETEGEFAPLFRRAWPFQECLVSSRIIHVGPRELSFECRACITCECGQHYKKGDSTTPRHVLARAVETSPIITRFFQKPRVIDDWSNMVENYSRLELTFETDRLIALGGYAQQYLQAYPGRQYLAGLWSHDLSHQLLWRNRSRHQNQSQNMPCVAPSWSWASSGAAIEYPWKNSHDLLKLSYKVLDFSCRPVDGNPFGAAIEGRVRLKGHLSPARLVLMAISVSDDTDSDSEIVHHTAVECKHLPGGFHFHDVRLDLGRPFEARRTSEQSRGFENRSGDDHLLSSADSKPSGLDSSDILLLKLFEADGKDEQASHSSIVYMMLSQESESGKPDTHGNFPSPVYKRLGIAVASLGGTRTREDTMSVRPSISTRRSSLVASWNRVVGINGDDGGEMVEVVII